MNHKEFCIWLEGYMDGIETGSEAPWLRQRECLLGEYKDE